MGDINTLRKIRDRLKKEISTPGYEERERIKIRSAIHDNANHMVDDYIKSPLQIAILNEMRPETKELRGRLVYLREKTIQKMHDIIEAFLDDNFQDELYELMRLKHFVKESAKLRINRNISMKFRHDPRKNGHDIARQYAIDRYNVFEKIFPNQNQPNFSN